MLDGTQTRKLPAILPIPWGIIAPHEQQAQRNHGGQTLQRLAERGGLSPCEAVAVLEDRSWHRMDLAESIDRLAEIIRNSTAAMTEENDDG